MIKKYIVLALILTTVSSTSYSKWFWKSETEVNKIESKVEIKDSENSGIELIKKSNKAKVEPIDIKIAQLYKELNLKNRLDYDIFRNAYLGYTKIDNKQREILTIVDYTKSSTKERLVVVDLKNRKVLLESYVAHGRNSGNDIPTSFSNVMSSNKSSLGFFLTENTYKGKNGYSLRLNGLEKDINDKAKARNIVVHGAKYANPSFAKSVGRLGRSEGCIALPESINRVAIDTIKGGSVIFVNGNDKNYLSKSKYLSRS